VSVLIKPTPKPIHNLYLFALVLEVLQFV
jgi:hypothetical protein